MLLEGLEPQGMFVIGVLGSHRAHADRIARLQAPVGLDLGGHSPAEMALSIVAEILALHNRCTGGQLRLASGPIHTDECYSCDVSNRIRASSTSV